MKSIHCIVVELWIRIMNTIIFKFKLILVVYQKLYILLKLFLWGGCVADNLFTLFNK
jgi:hypothetical protein